MPMSWIANPFAVPSKPCAPEVWPLNDSVVSSIPAPWIVTLSTSSDRSVRRRNVPAPNATVPPLATSMSAVCTSVSLAPSEIPTQVPSTPSHGSSLHPVAIARISRARRLIAGQSARNWSDRQGNWSVQSNPYRSHGIRNAIDHVVRLPKQLQLATLVDEAPAGDGWLHEQKFDGYRIVAERAGRRVHLLSRRFNDWTHQLPTVADAVAALPVES